MRFAFIGAEKVRHSVPMLCRMLRGIAERLLRVAATRTTRRALADARLGTLVVAGAPRGKWHVRQSADPRRPPWGWRARQPQARRAADEGAESRQRNEEAVASPVIAPSRRTQRASVPASNTTPPATSPGEPTGSAASRGRRSTRLGTRPARRPHAAVPRRTFYTGDGLLQSTRGPNNYERTTSHDPNGNLAGQIDLALKEQDLKVSLPNTRVMLQGGLFTVDFGTGEATKLTSLPHTFL
jgi:hypothetical protein